LVMTMVPEKTMILNGYNWVSRQLFSRDGIL